MLSFAFMVLAVIAALFSFSDIAASSVIIAKVFFFLFIVGFAVSLICGVLDRYDVGERKPPVY